MSRSIKRFSTLIQRRTAKLRISLLKKTFEVFPVDEQIAEVQLSYGIGISFLRAIA